MPEYLITSPDGKKYRVTAPDGATREDALAKVKSQLSEPPRQIPDQPRAITSDKPIQHETSWYDPVRSALQGATLGFADEAGSGITAAIKAPFSEQSFGEIYDETQARQRYERENFQRQNPKTALATEIAGGLGTGVAGGAKVLGANALKNAPTLAKTAAGALTGAVEGGLYGAGSAESGERLEGGAKGAAAGALTGGILTGATGVVQNKLAERAMMARRIKRGESSKALAGYKIGPESATGTQPNLLKDAAARKAMSQGFDEGFVQQIKTASPTDKRKILKMVRMGSRALRDNRFASRNRINQVVGESLAKRVDTLNSKASEAAGKLDDVAATLKGQSVRYDEPVQTFAGKLDDLNIQIGRNKEGRISVDLAGSDIEGASEAKGFIERILQRVDQPMDAYQVHKLKKYIDRQVTYGAGQDKGLKGDALRIIKGLRHDLDAALDGSFDEYNKVNTQYADNRQALDMLQDAWGGKVNMFNESASKQLGIQSRKLLSNYASGVNQIDAIENAEKIIQKYGGNIDDNIMDLVSAESALRSVIPQKLFNTFQGDMEKAGGTVARGLAGDQTGAAISIGQQLIDKARGRTPEAALKSLEKLLQDST